MDDLICYCFGYTAKDIEQDAAVNGKSTIFDLILSKKKTSGCWCADKNPKGICCLADVRKVAENAMKGKIEG
ncbi:MAG: hypothetical protein HYU64_02370 [Armatimonadetes bacterium]|nr:hypothetical protein [Armatimonadota bacterium]